MKAIVHRAYGPPETLSVEDIEPPAVAEGGVLVRVRAASVNPLDWYAVSGLPYLVRLGSGLRRPKKHALGTDFAGTVESVGSGAPFQPGDRVFGMRTGSFAEYVWVPAEHGIAPMPENLTFEQAAAVPVAAGTALQALRDKGRLAAGQRVLVNGAGGGVGTFAIQIAKVLGAEVTGVCGTHNVHLVRSLGADHVVDYTRDDFTRTGERYDLLLDIAGNRSWSDCKRILAPDATVVVVGGPKTNRWYGPLGHFAAFRLHGAVPFIATVDSACLKDLSDLLASGQVTPVIEHRYSLAELPEALRHLSEGHASGKLVVTV